MQTHPDDIYFHRVQQANVQLNLQTRYQQVVHRFCWSTSLYVFFKAEAQQLKSVHELQDVWCHDDLMIAQTTAQASV